MARQAKTVRKPNLTQATTLEIKRRISNRSLKPGDQLPTEQKLVEEFGVSRTVIRESIASLRADGLVEARHGVGVFVLDPPAKEADLHFLGEDPDRISSVVETLELRAAVEIEVAGIAAQRCSPGQEIRIHECYAEMRKNVAEGTSTQKSDFQFHKAIAEATGNPQFVGFLEYLGRRTIPRAQLRYVETDLDDFANYQQKLLDEHRAIMEAIGDRDSERAQEAMRKHLKGSQERYRRLLSQLH